MRKTLLISTGGTFNKVYNPNNGLLEIDRTSSALMDIASKWLCDFKMINIIGKDSLEMDENDRVLLLETIKEAKEEYIIVIHGTDTLEVTADFLAGASLKKTVVLTGAMVPYSIESVEAAANLASAFGYIQALETPGIYIAMNALMDSYEKIKKDKEKGKFSYQSFSSF